MLDMEVDGGGRLQPHSLPNFTDRGRIALIPDGIGNKIIYFLLHGGEFFHLIPSCTILPCIIAQHFENCNNCSIIFFIFFFILLAICVLIWYYKHYLMDIMPTGRQ